MARKASDSPELKAAIDAFSALSVEDQSLFRSKIFARLCNGLSKEQRVAFRKERLEFLERLEQEKKKTAQLASVAALSTAELEEILAARKKKK
ncbi:hypothetical protein [uncultured Victivallis sp.]|uniref:hypothetical protein n=1 Tax=uncultured Victivallis sp. TaxID=354118 RepID=UPI0025923D0C|nr:hypothetical protein [uncultured Victivallis sp.]